MDCVIPAHNVKIFMNAVSSLCKVGKELLLEFNPKSGLTLRTLNDAKSAFSSYKFTPSFFERCSSGASGNENGNFVINGNRRRRRRKMSDDDDDDEEEEDDDDDKYLCRVLLKTVASVLKPRRGVDTLRLRSVEDRSGVSRNDNDDNQESSIMRLVFEFRCEPGGLRISHRIGVAELENSISAVAPREQCSEIVTAPKVLMNLLGPLKRTVEVALTAIYNDKRKIVKLASFHHTDAASSSVDIALLGSNAMLKTETSMACEDFDEFLWKGNRIVPRQGDVSDDDESDDQESPDIPRSVNEEVILVFGIREVRVSATNFRPFV